MNADSWLDALRGALAPWESVVRHSGTHAVLVASGYAIAAGLCALAAGADRRDGASGAGWLAAGAVLVVLGACSLLRLDVLLVETMRAAARAQGWYAARRAWQYVVLVALAAAGLVVFAGLRARLAARWVDRAPLVAGLAILVAIAVLKGVSFHYTDQLVDARVAGASLGRLAEVAGLGLVAFGALRRVRDV